MDGLLVVDKPVGPTSHDVVARIRRLSGERRVGHTGTLDPMASGVLPLVLGRATRLARFLSASQKTYEAVIRLGIDTDTYDAEGQPSAVPHAGPLPDRATIDRALDAFRGEFMQTPPLFSAKKIGGVRSYRIARGGPPAVVPLPAPVPVTASELTMLSFEGDCVTLRITSSAGFYVRALAHDLGRALGVGAHLAKLRRTQSGRLTLDEAVALDTLERDPASLSRAMTPLARMLPEMPAVRLTDAGRVHARQGRDLGQADVAGLPAADETAQLVRLVDAAGDLVGVAGPARAPNLLHPAVILV
jgi:tRNA pseudouridine55 synthase